MEPMGPMGPMGLCGHMAPWDHGPHVGPCAQGSPWATWSHAPHVRPLTHVPYVAIAMEMQRQTAYTSIVEGRLIEKVMAYNSTHFDIHVIQRSTPILIHVRIYLTCSHAM